MPQKTYTKILATVGPSSESKEVLSKLINAGVDAFRFNFSHGTHADHKERYKIIRKLEKAKGVHLSIVADLQGPKLRVGNFKDGSVFLKEGAKFRLDMDAKPGDVERVCLPHKEIFKALKVGDELLLNDGNITLQVDKCGDNYALTTVKYGGILSGHKGVNLPNTHLPISAITSKDKEDLKMALKLGADWVSLSFVQTADDVRSARKLIGKKAGIISKLEKPSAIEDLDEIIQLSDAIMVARGDLGVECPVQTVPVLQKRIVTACRKYGKPVIVATQMLESMINAPMPTRAEVSDVATAVYDGADTVMLSAETAAGKYPVESVSMMNKIITEVEADKLFFTLMEKARNVVKCDSVADAITYAASEVASTLSNLAAIATYTSSGYTTMLMAKERPNLPILAITPLLNIARRMAIVWGVKSFVNKDSFKNFDQVEEATVKISKKSGLAKKGDHVLITAGLPFNESGKTNMLHTIEIK